MSQSATPRPPAPKPPFQSPLDPQRMEAAANNLFDPFQLAHGVATTGKSIWDAGIQIIEVLIKPVMLPWQMILRYNFGERHLSIPGVIGALAVLCGYAWWTSTIRSTPFTLFLPLLVVLLAVVHLHQIRARRMQGHRWHSRSSGHPWLHWPGAPIIGKPWTVVMFVEPVVVGLTGFVLLVGLRDLLGLHALAASVLLFLDAAGQRAKARSSLLDQIDNTIESEHIGEAISPDAAPQDTEGFVVPGASTWTDAERATLVAAYQKMLPSQQAMLDVTYAYTPAPPAQGHAAVQSPDPHDPADS